MNENKYTNLINYFNIINELSEQQSKSVNYSVGWNTIEKQIIEYECKLFNELIKLDIQEIEQLFKDIQILPALGLHLYKCMFTINYTIINDLLSEESKTFINIMWNYWQQVKGETIK